MPTLYVVATPIGNLNDLTRRAEETLRKVQVVAAEDTRVTSRLLAHIGARPRVISFHEDSPQVRVDEILGLLDQQDVALVTDAGTPGLSDPGAALVAAAAERGFPVEAVPGPSALTALLSVSGLAGDRVVFLGFLPRVASKRRAVLAEFAVHGSTMVLFEAPHRVRDCLADIAAALDDPLVVAGREMTKLHEEVFRGTATQALAHFEAPRGEFVIAVRPPERPAQEEVSDEVVMAALSAGRGEGFLGRALVNRVIAESGAPRSRVYRLELATRRVSQPLKGPSP